MVAHPRRNWRRKWRVDSAKHEARHESGLVVRFRRAEHGLVGDVVGEYPRSLSMLDAARYMREAGEMYERAMRGRGGPVPDPRPREIRGLREEMELTRRELAGLLLTTSRVIEAYEQGARRMPPLMQEAMQLLQASPAYERIVRAWRAGGDLPRQGSASR